MTDHDRARREAWAATLCACGHGRGAHGPRTGCHVAPCGCLSFTAGAEQ